MKKSQIILGAFSISIILSACSIKRRTYMNGYHVEWKHNKNKTSASERSYKLTANKPGNSVEKMEPVQGLLSKPNSENVRLIASAIMPKQGNESKTASSGNVNAAKNNSFFLTKSVRLITKQVTLENKKMSKKEMSRGVKLLIQLLVGLILFILIIAVIAALL